MTEPGTLQGLIVELKELHNCRTDLRGPDNPQCDHCQEGFYDPVLMDYPCPTMEIVRKHKCAQYELIEYADGPSEVHWNSKHYESYDDEPLFVGMKAECEAWIDQQVDS